MADGKDKTTTEQAKDAASGSSHKQKPKEKPPAKEKHSVVLPKIRKKTTATVSRCPEQEHATPSANAQDNSVPEYQSPLSALGPMQQDAMPFWGHGFPPMPFMPMGPPQWSWPEAEEDEILEDDDDDYADPELDNDQDGTSQPRPQTSSGQETSQQTGQLSALLAGHREKYADEQGENVAQELADLVNSVWTNKHAKESVTETLKRHPRPGNLKARKVDVNEEVISSISKGSRAKDMKMRSVQGLIARATVPIVETMSSLIKEDDEVNRQQLVDSAVDCITILSKANAQLNQLRRETLKPTLHPRYQTLCAKPQDDSELLFGSNFGERVKGASQGGKLARRGSSRGRGRFNPYPSPYGQHGYYNGYQGYPQPYGYQAQTRGNSRGRFLGECNNGFHETQNFINVLPDVTNHTKDIETNTLGPPFRGQEDKPQGPRPREPVNADDAEETSNSSVGQYENYSIKLIKSATFQAGKLENCSDKWSTLTSDPHILKIIRGFGIQFSDVPQQAHPQKEFQFSSEETYFLQQEIDRLLTQRVISKSVYNEGDFVSNIFLREKKESGKYRMILNLKKLNHFVDKKTFQNGHIKICHKYGNSRMLVPKPWFPRCLLQCTGCWTTQEIPEISISGCNLQI